MKRFPHRAAPMAAAAILATLFLTACGSGGDPPRPAKTEQYRAFLEASAANLVRMTGRLLAKIEAGENPRAGSRYASAHVFYGQVQPAAASFDDLDTRIDARAVDVPASEFGGFHRLEKAIFAEHSFKGMIPVARQLLTDVEELQEKIETAPLRATQIAKSASALLDELATSTVEGKEELYAHLDLIDVAARTEAAEAAFDALKPPLADLDPELEREIETAFTKVYAAVKLWGPLARDPDQPRAQEPGIAFVVYSELSPESVAEIARPIKALAELFSQVPDLIAQE